MFWLWVMVTVSLCKKGEKTRCAWATAVKPPHSLSRLNHGSAAQTQLSNPVKQKIIRLCSFVNLGWTYKLHICWFIVVDVPVAGVHCVEDHINGLTHLFFTLANGWGLGNVLQNVPQEHRPAYTPWKKYIFMEVTEVAQTLIHVCVLLVAL